MNFYKQKFAYYGQKVRFIKDGKKYSGKIVDVDKQNCLLLVSDSDGNTVKINSPSNIILSQKFNLLKLFK